MNKKLVMSIFLCATIAHVRNNLCMEETSHGCSKKIFTIADFETLADFTRNSGLILEYAEPFLKEFAGRTVSAAIVMKYIDDDLKAKMNDLEDGPFPKKQVDAVKKEMELQYTHLKKTLYDIFEKAHSKKKPSLEIALAEKSVQKKNSSLEKKKQFIFHESEKLRESLLEIYKKYTGKVDYLTAGYTREYKFYRAAADYVCGLKLSEDEVKQKITYLIDREKEYEKKPTMSFMMVGSTSKGIESISGEQHAKKQPWDEIEKDLLECLFSHAIEENSQNQKKEID